MMARKQWITLGLASLVAIAGSGCADNKYKERISKLENQNSQLTEELNRAAANLDDAERRRAEWDRALAEARREADRLRSQLAEAKNQPPQIIREPAAAPGWTSVPGGAMIAIEGSVLFAPGKAVLRDQSKKTLDSIVSALQGQYSDKDILVFGHTDNTPIKKSGWDDNWQLSSERALAVVRYLTSRGVGAARLAACGCGEHRPRASNRDESGRSRNRRVEIFALEPQSSSGRS